MTVDLNTIPYYKIYKQKINMPKDPKTSTMYNMILINNLNISDSINAMNHPLFKSNSKYLTYYTDRLYSGKLFNKSFRVDKRVEREELYKTINDNFSFIKTPITFNQVKLKNVYFDLVFYNQMFFKYAKSNIHIRRRASEYFNYVGKLAQDPRFDNYKTKLMFIDVRSWADKIDNPLFYIFYCLKLKLFELLEPLGDIDIIVYDDTKFFKFNPAKYDEKEFPLLKLMLSKLYKGLNLSNDELVDKEIEREEIKADITNTVNNKFPSDNSNNIEEDEDVDDEDFDDLEDSDDDLKISDEIDNEDEKIDDTPDTDIDDIEEEPINISKKELEKKLKDKIDSDDNLVKELKKLNTDNPTGKSSIYMNRENYLREKQKAIKIENLDIEKFLNTESLNIEIPEVDISTKISSTNENVKKIKFGNFEKTYANVSKQDTLNEILNLNNMEIPIFVKDIKIEDSSDELNYKETYRVSLEDPNGVKHSLTFDMPKLIDDKYIYINGNKKFIMKQLFMKPVVKTGPDTVQIITNYNKIFITRYGTKMSPKIERLKRTLANPNVGLNIEYGDNTSINTKYRTTLDYDELGKSFYSIKNNKIELLFNQEKVFERLGDTKLKDDDFCIGFYHDGKPIIISFKTEKIDGSDLVDFIVKNLNDKALKIYNETTPGGKSFMYSRAKIMNKHVPLILLLGYCEGITTVLKKANIKHYFTDKRPTISEDEGSIPFADGYLVYDKYPFENSLLMNALTSIPTKAFEYSAFDERETYVELFGVLYSAKNLANAFNTFYEFMIDPITKEVLTDLDYPTDFVSLVIFANSLLSDNTYITENNMNLYRIRSTEIINGLLHKQIANAYAKYRNTANNKNPVKLSIPKDAVIKELLTVNILEEHSTLNPIYEIEKMRAVTSKGPDGLNLENAYTQDKRAYDKTMMGIVGMSSSPDANVGVVKTLTLEPNIVSSRGYIDINDSDYKSLNDVNLFTPAELLTPTGSSHDDAVRTAIKTLSHIYSNIY